MGDAAGSDRVVADIQTHIERMNKRLQSQEDTAIELENVVKSRMSTRGRVGRAG